MSPLSSSSSPDRVAAWLALAALLACAAQAQEPLDLPPPTVLRAMEGIQGQDILDHAKALSGERFAGRQAGEDGVRLAATHIADDFREMGLRPGGLAGGYFQPFSIRPGLQVAGELSAWIGETHLRDFRFGVDFMPLHVPTGKAQATAGLALAGYGITAPELEFDEYRGLDVKDKAVLIFAGTPWTPKAEVWLRRAADDQAVPTAASKARNAADHGAALVLLASNPAAWNADLPVSRRLSMPEGGAPIDARVPVIHVSLSAAAELAGMSVSELRLLAADISGQREPQSCVLRGRRVHLSAAIAGEPVLGRNIMAALPGRDDRLKSQAVIVGAHYDHLGEGGGRIYFGANDNASGVGCLLAVAQAFARLPEPPRRTVVFAAFDAEEIGRLGSRHYSNEPVVPIRDTVLMVNFDMVGRNVPDEIMAVGSRSSPELHRLHQEANRLVGLRLVHPASYRLGRSDHTWFYYARVPIFYLFGGIDPDYNTPQDTWDKLIPAKMERVARLAFLTAWAVAEREQRLTFDDAGAPLPAAAPAPRPERPPEP